MIRLKTVIMEHNLHDVAEMARYARTHGLEVFYQPIEQNYNTPEDPRWFEHSDNWPKDRERAVAAVQELIELKRQGLPIANSEHQLEVMIPYFRDPERLLDPHPEPQAHEKPLCSALTTMQIQSNGDVKSCWCMDPIGNITETPIRQIWESRPRWWESGCCMGRRMSEAEKAFVGLTRAFVKPSARRSRCRSRSRIERSLSVGAAEPEIMPTDSTLEPPPIGRSARSRGRPAQASALRPEARSRGEVRLDRGTDPDAGPVVPGAGQPVPAGVPPAARLRIGEPVRPGRARGRGAGPDAVSASARCAGCSG